jgi:hypothetical protein
MSSKYYEMKCRTLQQELSALFLSSIKQPPTAKALIYAANQWQLK